MIHQNDGTNDAVRFISHSFYMCLLHIYMILPKTNLKKYRAVLILQRY